MSKALLHDSACIYKKVSELSDDKYGHPNIIKAINEWETGTKGLLNAIATTKGLIDQSLNNSSGCDSSSLISRLQAVESRLAQIEKQLTLKPTSHSDKESKKAEEELDDFDLFGDEEAPEPKPKVEEPKKKKKQEIFKSSILFEIMPYDTETDFDQLVGKIKQISMDGLVWGQHGIEDFAYGIQKLLIPCVVEDEKVSAQDIEDQIAELSELVQSVSIKSFNKTA